MQAGLTTTRLSAAPQPFVAAAKPRRATAARASSEQAPEQLPQLRRRAALAALLAGVPALGLAAPALALIPDDDDEDLVEKARANRRAKLAEEKATEREFERSAGYTKALEKDLIPVQKAVTALARAGAALEASDARAAASALG